MVDLALLAYSGIAALCVMIAIILVTNHGAWLPIVARLVSTITAGWQSSVEQAKAQKARRERLYGYTDMSSYAPVREQFGTGSPGGSSGSDDPVLGQQHQLEPAEPGDGEPAPESLVRQLDKEELIIVLAVQRNADGGYLYSANQITTFVGGAAAPIKATIATVRGKRETPSPVKSLQRPINGW